MPQLRYAFCGTPQISVEALKQIVPEIGMPQLIITNEDKPKGRGQKPSFPPLKIFACEHDLPILQPLDLRTPNFLTAIAETNLDLIITCAYGKFFPKKLLTLPKWNCWNIHYSLLPKFRGAAPLQFALLEGETKTGITIFEMVKAMDAGPIWSQIEMPIQPNDNLENIYQNITALILPAVKMAIKNRLTGQQPMPQDPEKATFAPKIEKEMLQIDWQQPAEKIHNQIRAFSPAPGAFTIFGKKKRLKIFASSIMEKTAVSAKTPGTIVHIEKEKGFDVACGRGILRILELQPPNKKRMPSYAFWLGYSPEKLG